MQRIDNVYIGESGRELQDRLNEHRRNLAQYNQNSLIY